MSNIFSSHSHARSPSFSSNPTNPVITLHPAKPKPSKKTSSANAGALLSMHGVTQAFAVYPERPELISRSTLLKVEGMFGTEELCGEMRGREGWVLVMPEIDPSTLRRICFTSLTYPLV